MKNNVLVEKSFDFAVNVVLYCRWLVAERKEFVISKQLLKSGTSVGANVEEGEGAISKKEFIAKLQIAYKEARETRYWLRLLIATSNHPDDQAKTLLPKIEELLRILVAILKSSKGDNDTPPTT